MARIAGVNIPTNKRLIIALTYIYGIGRKSSQDICNTLQVPETRRVKDLTDLEILKIRNLLRSIFVLKVICVRKS